MANKKMTKRDYFNILKGAYPTTAEDYNEVIGFIDHELELLEKKNSADKKPTATQVANEGIKTEIYNKMVANGGLMTITDIQKELDSELSNQRVSALVRQLVNDGKVERTEEKRKAYFKAI